MPRNRYIKIIKFPPTLSHKDILRPFGTLIPAEIRPQIPMQLLIPATFRARMNKFTLRAYRNAIITKKLASMAFYNFGLDWDAFIASFEKDVIGSLYKTVSSTSTTAPEAGDR